MNTATVRILGIDPGYGRLGWCIGQTTGVQLELLDYGCIETDAQLPLMARYSELQKKLKNLVDKYGPEEAALESLFFSKNQKTAMQVSEARGLVLGVLLAKHVRCYDYNPLQIKQAVTGFGKADKASVERMLRLQFRIDHEKILDDTMDAIAVTLTHSVSRALKKYL